MHMSEQRDEIAQRRALRRKKIRRRRLFLFFVFFMITALAVGVALSLTILFPVKNVVAAGSKLYSAEQLKDASTLTEKSNIFTFSEKTVTDKLRQTLPYIDTIKIKRELPGTVYITVKDAEEYACYELSGGFYTVSKSGFVLNRYDAQPENVFLVKCGGRVRCSVGSSVSFSDKKTEQLIDTMIDAMSQYDIPVNYIDVTDTLNLSAKVSGRFLVNFGTNSDLEKKIAHLSGMITSIGESRTGRINLSMWSSDKTEGSFTEGGIE